MKYIYFTLLLLLLPITAIAAGLQVSPSKLEMSVTGKPVATTLVVVNPTADVQLFEVYVSDFDKLITLRPASFTLQSGQRQNVAVSVNPTYMPSGSGMVSTDVSIVGRPLAQSNVPVGTGVKVPLTVTLSTRRVPTTQQLVYAFAIVVAVSLGAYFTWKRKRR